MVERGRHVGLVSLGGREGRRAVHVPGQAIEHRVKLIDRDEADAGLVLEALYLITSINGCLFFKSNRWKLIRQTSRYSLIMSVMSKSAIIWYFWSIIIGKILTARSCSRSHDLALDPVG